MKLSDKGSKRFNTIMKKMGFSNSDLFLKYCVLNTIKSKVTESQKKQVLKEMKAVKEAGE